MQKNCSLQALLTLSVSHIAMGVTIQGVNDPFATKIQTFVFWKTQGKVVLSLQECTLMAMTFCLAEWKKRIFIFKLSKNQKVSNEKEEKLSQPLEWSTWMTTAHLKNYALWKTSKFCIKPAYKNKNVAEQNVFFTLLQVTTPKVLVESVL